MHRAMGDFRIDGMAMRYSSFVGRLYNWCRELGFDPQHTLPSRAFCSDENQGYPVILLTQQFGTFPFNHGRAGGMVADDRHGTYAHHGGDLVLLQASHVGFDPQTQAFGIYRRTRTRDHHHTGSCGKLAATVAWYQQQYERAQHDIRLGRFDGSLAVIIDNSLLDTDRSEGLMPRLDRLIDGFGADGGVMPLRVFSTAKAFVAAPWLVEHLGESAFGEAPAPIGRGLIPDLFTFRRAIPVGEEGQDQLERNLFPAMRSIVTARWPALDAARYNTQVEFDRTYRGLQTVPEFEGKNLLFISGLHIDISPGGSLAFPLTKFIPWAACHRRSDGTVRVLEQAELAAVLRAQSPDTPDCMDLDDEIAAMRRADEIKLPPLG